MGTKKKKKEEGRSESNDLLPEITVTEIINILSLLIEFHKLTVAWGAWN